MAGVPCSQLSKQYHIRATNIQYLIRLITRHGYRIVEKQKNRYYNAELKKEIINKVLINQLSVAGTVIKYGLTSNGILFN